MRSRNLGKFVNKVFGSTNKSYLRFVILKGNQQSEIVTFTSFCGNGSPTGWNSVDCVFSERENMPQTYIRLVHTTTIMGLEIFYTSFSRWKKKLHFGPVFVVVTIGYSYFMPLPPSADVDLQLVVRESDGAMPCSVCRGDMLYTFVHVCTQEAYIAELDAKSGASLKLTILNAKGRIWTMVAGGGASVIYAWVTPLASSPHILTPPPPWTYHLPTLRTPSTPCPPSPTPTIPSPPTPTFSLPPALYPPATCKMHSWCVCVCVCVN